MGYLDEQSIQVVKVTLHEKSGGDDLVLYFSTDYHSASELYSGSPQIYPLLAENPTYRRSFEQHAAVRHDVTFAFYAHGFATPAGQTLSTLRTQYEFHNSKIDCYYWTDSFAALSARQQLEIIAVDQDAAGILKITGRDTWFRDIEITKRMTLADFAELDDKWIGEVGPLVFGRAGASGVVVNAPMIDHSIESSVPTVDLFTGWGFTGNAVKSLEALWTRNQWKDIDPKEWLETSPLSAGSNNVVAGNSSPYPYAYKMRVGHYARAYVWSPSSTAQIIHGARCSLSLPGNYGSTYFDGTGYCWCQPNSALQIGDEDFSFYCVIRADTGALAAERVIAAFGDSSKNQREFIIRTTAAADLEFKISPDGTTSSNITATWGSALSVETTYHIWAWFDSAADTMYLSVNNGAAVDEATSTTAPGKRGGAVEIGSEGFSNLWKGNICCCGFWKAVVGSTERTSIYDSGNSTTHSDLTAAERQGLVWWCNMDELGATQLREDKEGNNDLSPMVVTWSDTIGPPLTLTADDGELVCSVYQCEYLPTAATYAPIGSALRQTHIDPQDVQWGMIAGFAYFQFEPLLTSPDADYMMIFEWSNKSVPQRTPYLYYSAAAGTHYAKYCLENNRGWEPQAVKFDFTIYGFGLNTAWDDGPPYAYLPLSGMSITIPTSGTRLDIDGSLEYKAEVQGVQDNSSGTYTGAAYGLIFEAPDIVHFILRHAELVNHGSGNLDTTEIAASGASTTTASIEIGAGIEERTFAYNLILELCRQSRTVFYKQRDGQLSVKYPTPLDGSYTYQLTSAKLGDLLRIEGEADTDIGSLINDVEIGYAVDALNIPEDVDRIRRSRGRRTAYSIVINDTESSFGDDVRKNIAAAAIALYGRREHRSNYWMIHTSGGAQTNANYLFDRNCKPRKRVTVRVPMTRYYAADFWSTVRAESPMLAGNSSREIVPQCDDDTLITTYYEGVPISAYAAGEHYGEVCEVLESGNDIVLIVESVLSFCQYNKGNTT